MGVAHDTFPSERNKRWNKDMKTPIELTPQERYDIVSYRMENAEKTLGEIDALISLPNEPQQDILNPL